MPRPVQKVLSHAAAIGPVFDLSLLGTLYEAGKANSQTHTKGQHRSVAGYLKTAVHENFILPLDLDAERSLNQELMTDIAANIDNMIVSAVSAVNTGTWVDVSTVVSNSILSGKHYYRFAHDRVQQAAASILGEAETAGVHFVIAEELLKANTDPKEFDDNLFVIVNHLNQGISLERLPFDMPESKESSSPYLPITAVSAARLNLMVCVKAKKTNSHAHILACANMGIKLLEMKGEACWESENYETIFALYKFKAEMEYLLGNYAVAEAMYPALLEHAKSIFDKADVHSIMGGQYEVQLRLGDLMSTIASALKLFDITLPIGADIAEQERQFRWELESVDKLVKPDQIMELVNIQSSNDRTHLYTMKLLFAIWAPSYIQSMRALAGIISTQMVRRTLTFGLCEESTMGLTSMPFFSGPFTRNYTTSHEFAKLGLHLLENRYPHNKLLRGIAYCFYGVGVRHYKMPLRSCTPYLEAAHENSKQAGDMAWASYGAPYILAYMVFQGSLLSEVLEAHKRYLPFWKNSENWLFGAFSYQYAYIASRLMDEPEPERARDYNIGDNPFVDAFYNQSRLTLSFFMRDRQATLAFADKACAIAPAVFIAIYVQQETNFLCALIYLDWLRRFPFHELFDCDINDFTMYDADIESERDLTRAERVALMKTRIHNINEYTESLQYLIQFCPDNFEHKHTLLMAERAHTKMILGFDIFDESIDFGDKLETEGALPALPATIKKPDFGEILDLYKKAIDGAHDTRFYQYEAAGLELLGRFWLSTQALYQKRVAIVYLNEAISVYEKWGAIAKAKAVQAECLALDSFANPVHKWQAISTADSKEEDESPMLPFLDLNIVVQASQTISAEMDLNILILKLMKVIVEHSNAQKGTFFTVDESKDEQKELLLVTAEYEILDDDFESKIRKQPNIVIHNTSQDCLPLSLWHNGPISIVNFVMHTKKPLILVNAHEDPQFGTDVYITQKGVKSVMCVPILLKSKLKGIMYLENNLYEGLYTKDRLDILSVLTSSMAISLENAQYFHAKLEHQLEKIRFEQLQQDEERQRLRADAAEKYKRQLENFVDMICHEIRNPLNGIFGNAELILHYLKAADSLSLQNSTNPQLDLLADYLSQMQVCASSVQTCAEHQKCMTDDVLELSRLRAHKLSLANDFYYPHELLHVVMSMFSVQAATKELQLEVINPQPPFDSVRVYGDSIRLSQILTNLVSNAIKFTHSGGIYITVSIVDLSQESSETDNNFNTKNDDNLVSCYLKITVRDTGIGMTPEEQACVFKRFSQANNRMSKEYGGSGLGLAISRKLAKLMKGTITLHSEKGVGSTFSVTVLCEREKLQNNKTNNNSSEDERSISTSQILQANSSVAHYSNNLPPASTLAKAKKQEDKHIMIVEDNVMNQLLLSRLLQLHGYTVAVANNGKEGCAKYVAQVNTDKPFMTILMDWQMPIMDGLEATIYIRDYERENNLKPVNIIGLSGNARDDYKQQALASGMNQYITKPYKKEELFIYIEATGN